MCITNNLQKHIRNLTNDGEVVARFLVNTVEGKTPGAKPCHQLEAMKHLIRFGFTDDTNRLSRAGGNPEGRGEGRSHFWGLIPTPEELAAEKNTPSPSMGEGWDGGDESPLPLRRRVREGASLSSPPSMSESVTHLDILNYDIAHLIRTETADGHTIAEFLSDVMTRRDKPFTPKKLRIRHTDRMAAAREILRRGFGHFGRKRKLVIDDHDEESNDYDTLHTDLAKRMREYTEHGTDAVRFLLDVMEDANPDEPYTWHHRMSAAHELLRRGWDTNYDHITPQMLQDYWRNQQSTRLSVAQKKHLAGLPVAVDDYNTYDNEDYQAKAQDLEAISPIEKSPLSLRERATSLPLRRQGVRVNTPESSSSKNPAERKGGNQSPFPLRGKVRKGGNANTLSLSKKQETDAEEQDRISSPPCTSMSIPLDDKPDCYHEPLNPDQQAIFDYQLQIESGEYEPGEITIGQPTPEDWKSFEQALAQLKELAAAEGVPLLPNPLAGTLKMPTIRSP